MLHHSTNYIAVREDYGDKYWSLLPFSHNVRAKMFFIKDNTTRAESINWNEYSPIDYEENVKFIWTVSRNYKILYNVPKKVHTTSNIDLTMGLQCFISKQNPYGVLRLIKNTIIDNEELLLNNFRHGITFCSDGGARYGKGSYGLTSIIQNQTVLRCFNRVHEIYEETNSHRCEALGILATLILIETIDSYTRMKKLLETYPYKIRLLCDNESVVKTINKIKNNKLTLKQQYSANIDVLRAIKIKIKTLEQRNCQVLISHIKGHQDKNKSKLNNDEKMNVKADELATLGLIKKKLDQSESMLLPADRCQLFINNKKVCSNYTRLLRENYHSRNMYQYLQEKYNWSDRIIDNIWWEVHGKALVNLLEGK
jgi:ribonuclease HI